MAALAPGRIRALFEEPDQVHRLSNGALKKGMGGEPSPESRAINLQIADVAVERALRRNRLFSRDCVSSHALDVTTEIVVSPVRVRVSPS
jgi:hypothetical protein